MGFPVGGLGKPAGGPTGDLAGGALIGPLDTPGGSPLFLLGIGFS